VLITRAVSSFGDQYDVSEFYKTGLRPSQILEAVGQKDRIYDYKRIWADPSRPDMIAELQSAGFPVIPAENDIQKGIDTHYELIRSGSYKISKDCKYTIDEYETYHYPDEGEVKVDKSRNKTKIETPVDQSNHCMDVARYLSMGLRNSRVKHTPKLAIN
jgi:phage terminase large subunit